MVQGDENEAIAQFRFIKKLENSEYSFWEVSWKSDQVLTLYRKVDINFITVVRTLVASYSQDFS